MKSEPARLYSWTGVLNLKFRSCSELRLAEGAEAMVADQAAAAGAADRTLPPYACNAVVVVEAAGSDADSGLSQAEAASRLSTHGANEIVSEKPPSIWAVALLQLRDPMNIMLVAVTVVSILIGQVSTGIVVGLLILLNVALGTRQELKARASVDALSKMQVPQARVVRDGDVRLVPASEVVPGDIVYVEAGDIVPADGRIVRSATLETQEAALTGESAPIGKDPAALASADVALGDRTNMLFQNTSVTRGTGSMVVTATGMQTQMGQIATMLTAVTRTRSPLQTRARLADQGAWHHRVGRRGRHCGGRLHPRHADPGSATARHGNGDLGDPDRSAGICVRTPVDRSEATRRGQGSGQKPHRR